MIRHRVLTAVAVRALSAIQAGISRKRRPVVGTRFPGQALVTVGALAMFTALALDARRGSEAGSGTPVATPAAAGTASGPARCDVEPLPAISPVPVVEDAPAPPPDSSGPTPAASVVPVNQVQVFGQPPGIAWADVPAGEQASPEVVAEIQATLDRMTACTRLGLEYHVAAFYSEDFYRRPWVRWQLRYNGYWVWAPGAPGILVDEFEQAFVLPDGRVAVVYRWGGFLERDLGPAIPVEYGYLIVFVEQEGRWLVDEFVEIAPFGQGVG